ncbi:MAG: hypothetical protein KF773_16560 [Deltaproteobacteria bacterium]|nr:hypothetical protein [Deltaproteobacteria bacterium]
MQTRALGLACLVAAGGCRCNGERAPRNTPTATQPRGIAQCEYLPEADATRILGAPARYRSADPLDPTAPACELLTSTNIRVVLQVSTDTAAYEFATANGGAPVRDLGDGALWLAGAHHMVATRYGRDAGLSVIDPAGRVDARAKAAELLAVVLAHM